MAGSRREESTCVSVAVTSGVGSSVHRRIAVEAVCDAVVAEGQVVTAVVEEVGAGAIDAGLLVGLNVSRC